MPVDPYQQLVDWWRSVKGSNELSRQYIQGGYGLERFITNSLGLQPTIEYAQRRPSELGYPDSHGDEKALRHLLLSAELHRTHPLLADPLLYGHEYLTNVLQGQSLEDRYKDLHNNSLGKYIGQRSPDRATAEAWAHAAMSHADTTDYGR